ncbi:L-2-amino-thiazoline-4-carboxylic acid hydrolase [Roseovarius pelagicus]|uniref:L-2-amino-thiazoline-4-carboxylic acid hydrolase n=1 Tax=Roseovarius pelagicus TaxID=2980108 RepID=A0ABY6DGT7_9RHOB|nr:L-2-amino-thiazoline-4-carboxylic acid hydrolase [Roseovarius pelagicus]UXX85255.1 L-2-amino-thiazoline-4-carboxylic acid hydrolase [Roseovarius pelagicus]
MTERRISTVRPSPGWRAVRRLLRREVRRTCRRHLGNRALRLENGDTLRWLPEEIDSFLATLEQTVADMRDVAEVQTLPNAGSRLMVELAIYTIAADAALRRHEVRVECAHSVVADVGWDLYRRLLRLSSLPSRIVSRDPGRRLRWTIRALLIFPFRPVGAPGYETRVFRDGDDLNTHFTHCPPQTFARKAFARYEDPELLEAFRQSWCRYDWPGADFIASDGKRGHYQRPHTLSAGDRVCDMCWKAQAYGQMSRPNGTSRFDERNV